MAHTLPDYSTSYRLATVFGNIDTAELAARLGSTSIFNREGNVIWYDDFEAAVLHWNTVISGAGGAAALSNVSALFKDQSVKLTGGSDAGKYALIWRPLALPINTRLGGEVSFTNHANLSIFEFQMSAYDGTNLYDSSIRFVKTDGKLYYKNSTGGYTEFLPNIDFYVDDFMYKPLKYVIDLSTKKYVRCIFGNQEYDLSNISIRTTASAVSPYLVLQIWVLSTAGNNPYCYVDNVIITQNEV